MTSLRGSRVFVTGATGLLGPYLVRELLRRGAEVVCLVRDAVPRSLFFDPDPDWRLFEKVTVVRGEVEDFAVLERTINEYEVDTIFHLAAQAIVGAANRGPLATFRANVEGSWNLLEAARQHERKVRRVIVASSDKAYGSLAGEVYDEETPLRGEHPYDVSKSCADLIARSYFATYGLPVAVTRCGNLFGPGDLNPSRIIPGTIASLLAGQRPVIRSDGSYVRDYLFVEDAALAYVKLAERMAERTPAAHAGEAFNFSYGLRLTALEVVERIRAAMGRLDLAPVVLDEVRGEIRVQTLDAAKARRVLGWSPEIGFEQGLARTIARARAQAG